MSTTPPPPQPEQPPQRGYGYAHGAANPFTGMTIPFNSELVVFLLVEILFFILWLASKYVNADGFMVATAAVTVGYLISRGIAKASRVIEQ
jgi:hypothetical protein